MSDREQGATIVTHFAAVGTDGTRLVVWGLGTTEDEAEADACEQEGSNGVELTTVQITAEQAELVRAGVVSVDELGIPVESLRKPLNL